MYLLRKPNSSHWYVCFLDLQGRLRRWSAFPSKTLSESWGRKLQHCIDTRRAGDRLDDDLRNWARALPQKRAAQLLRLGIILPGDCGSEAIDVLAIKYRRHLESLNRTPEHTRHTMAQIAVCVAGLGLERLDDLDGDALLHFLRGLRGRLSAATVNHHLVSVKSFVAWAVRNKHLGADPIAHVRRLNVAVEGVTRNRRALTDSEIVKLLKNAKKENRLLYRFALATGLRRGEIAGLKIGNIDLKGGWAHVPAAYSRKAGRLRSVPLSSALCRELRTAWRGRKASELAFSVPRRAAEVLAEDLKAAGINGRAHGLTVDFHSLRHTFASRAGKATDTFADLMELLGHKTPAMTARYAHAEKTRLRQTAEKIAKG